jgi:NAD(P)-dependent dehydrogenase (short-subunit alcohol dehydrogenase family)
MSFADFSATPLSEFLSFEGRTVVVTGGARGIGLGIAARFSEVGADLYLADLDGAAAGAVAATLGPSVRGVRFDAGDPDAHDRLATRVRTETGRLDVWVNNAAIYPAHALLAASVEEWRSVMAVDLDGAMWGIAAAGRVMRQCGNGGCVINIVSTSGLRLGGPRLAAYTTAKHGLVGLTKAAALELAPYGVRVLGIAPSLTDTPGVREQSASVVAALGDDPHSRFAQLVPAGRIGKPDDVARVAVFCASGLASYMTGSTIPVDGGKLLT